jgi:hypothetical protein
MMLDCASLFLSLNSEDKNRLAGREFSSYMGKKFPKAKLPYRKDQIDRAKKEFDVLVQERFLSFYDIYSNSVLGGKLEGSNQPVLLLGSERIRAPEVVQNFGGLNSVEVGAVFNARPWSLLANDLMILGTIHAKKVVYLGDLERLSETDARTSVLGRELAQLAAAGYKRLEHPYEDTVGAVFVCSNPELADSISLFNLRKAVSEEG